MQRKQNDDQHLGICHRLFNFILNSLIGRGLRRVTLGHPMQPQPQGAGLTNQVAVDEYATRNGVHEPLLNHVKPKGAAAQRVDLKIKDDPDAAVQIRFKQTDEQELDDWTPVDKLGSSVHAASKDDRKANGISVGTSSTTTKPKVQGEGSTGRPKVIIPIKDSAAGQEEKKKKAGNKIPRPRPDSATSAQPHASSKPVLTGLGLNINEISETFIQNTKERMSRNVSRMEREDS